MPNKKWNLQDIRPTDTERRQTAVAAERPQVPERRGSDMRRKPAPAVQTAVEEPEEGVSSIIVEDGNSNKKKRLVISIVVGALILIGGFGIPTMIGGAEVAINPKHKDVSVQATFIGKTAPAVGELGYELLTLEANGERQVSATGKESVSERAKGSLFIYNAHSEGTQRLIKNTRFESPEGLIFRITESVEVPGKTTDSKGNVVPGVIEAEVFADGTGEQYNVEPSRFTIPGLKDTDQYSTVYAESKKPMAGGFEGERFIIDNAELETAKQALHTELRDALLARLETEKPAGFVLYGDSVTFTFESLPATEYTDGMATIKESARLQVPLFKTEEFAQFIAENTVVGFENEPVALTDPYTLTFKYTRATTSRSDISVSDKLEFDLSGNTEVVWQFDQEKLKNDLKGVEKTALPIILSGYPAIERAEAIIRPFWTQKFPQNPDEIILNVTVAR